MRIAQIAPQWERVPPIAYGGIELVVGLLTEELVRRGHEVTLFATGDSLTSAVLDSVCPQALRLDPTVQEPAVYEALQLMHVYDQAHEFDVIHSHTGYTTLPYTKSVKTPTVHTLHGIFSADGSKLFQQAHRQNYVSISNAQRQPMPGLNYLATVYNAINVNSHCFYPQPQDPPYLAFLGRISPEKGPHHAIEIAKRTGFPLKMAGKVDVVDVEYYEQVIKPHIDGTQIQFLGEANHQQKNSLLGGAIAMLFPITWREPFGLVMIESMAAGTPVIATRMGSTSEVIADGKTGFVVDTIDDYVAAVGRLETIDRHACRAHVEKNFNIRQMVDGYEAVYSSLLTERFSQNGYSSGRLELMAG